VFSYEFHVLVYYFPYDSFFFKDWFNLVKSSVALLSACFLAKSSLADSQVGGNCIYQGHRRGGSDTGCILLKRVPLHGTLAVRPCSVVVRTVTKFRLTPWCPQGLMCGIEDKIPVISEFFS
jgi:hypothetical protein